MTLAAPQRTLLASVERPGTAGAMSEAVHLTEGLAEVGKVLSGKVKPHWKIPEHLGIHPCSDLAGEDHAVLVTTLKRNLALFWQEDSPVDPTVDRSAVWDTRQHDPALLSSVRWMPLQYGQARGD